MRGFYVTVKEGVEIQAPSFMPVGLLFTDSTQAIDQYKSVLVCKPM